MRPLALLIIRVAQNAAAGHAIIVTHLGLRCSVSFVYFYDMGSRCTYVDESTLPFPFNAILRLLLLVTGLHFAMRQANATIYIMSCKSL